MVTTATRSRRNAMSTNIIETENVTTPEPGALQAKGKRTCTKKP
jgi:hypothetical protein